MWQKWEGCQCIRHILFENGYDSLHSLRLLDETSLVSVENCVNEDRQRILQTIPQCVHSKTYLEQNSFKFLIGHKIALLKWCKALDENEPQSSLSSTFSLHNSAFSPILRDMIIAALGNFDKPPNRRSYSSLLMDFGIYLYIMVGKASYEIIAANTPVPKAKTICEY